MPVRSRLASHHTALARTALLQFLGADPNIYCVVWTANASSAMRIVGEGYPWHPTSRLFLGHDSHSLFQCVFRVCMFEADRDTRQHEWPKGIRTQRWGSCRLLYSVRIWWVERKMVYIGVCKPIRIVPNLNFMDIRISKQKVCDLRPSTSNNHPGIFGLTGTARTH